MTYENPPSRLAGARRMLPAAEPGLHVDYADVLAQAVVNEREKILRELISEISQVKVTKSYSRTYEPEIRPENVKSEILSIIKRKQA